MLENILNIWNTQSGNMKVLIIIGVLIIVTGVIDTIGKIFKYIFKPSGLGKPDISYKYKHKK